MILPNPQTVRACLCFVWQLYEDGLFLWIDMDDAYRQKDVIALFHQKISLHPNRMSAIVEIDEVCDHF